MLHRKPITPQGISAALQKADRYRLINDPTSAESICLDILEVDGQNQRAIVTLVLALTDQMLDEPTECVRRARELLPRLRDEYKRAYYAGIVAERRAKAQLRRGGHGAGEIAYGWFREALDWYAKAEQLRPAGNDEAILRWNACVRLLDRHEDVKPRPMEEYEPSLED